MSLSIAWTLPLSVRGWVVGLPNGLKLLRLDTHVPDNCDATLGAAPQWAGHNQRNENPVFNGRLPAL